MAVPIAIIYFLLFVSDAHNRKTFKIWRSHEKKIPEKNTIDLTPVDIHIIQRLYI